MMDAFRQDLIEKLGEAKLAKIEKARIGIAGAGGLGSNCAACLVRVGFRHFTIVDFDGVDPSNLDRQFYFEDQVGMKKVEALRANLLRINPGLELQMLPVKLEPANIPEIFRLSQRREPNASARPGGLIHLPIDQDSFGKHGRPIRQF